MSVILYRIDQTSRVLYQKQYQKSALLFLCYLVNLILISVKLKLKVTKSSFEMSKTINF